MTSPVAGVLAEGALEELDGTPIRPPLGVSADGRARPAASWWRAAGLATQQTVRRPGLWPFALVAFLARGGLLLLAFPIVVLPTLIGLSNLVGPASVTAGGPAPRLVVLVGVGVGAGLLLVLVGTLVAAVAETAFLRECTAPGPSGRPRITFGKAVAAAGVRRGSLRVLAIRLVLLVPLAIAVLAALPAWVETAYRELTLPSDLGTPLVVRGVTGAPAASGLVAVAWLAGEVVGGFAVRRAVLLDTGWPRALAQGLVDTIGTPVGTLLTAAAALVSAIGTLLPAMWVLAAAWELARVPLVDEGLVPAAVGGTLVLGAAWAGTLVLAAIAATWRGCLATAELLRRGGIPTAKAEVTVPDLRPAVDVGE